jgi:uncharacterized protein with von Willebrand factor type A (vWA) domain
VEEGTVPWLQEWQAAVRSVMVPGASANAAPEVALPPELISAIGRDLLKTLFRTNASPAPGEHGVILPGNAGDVAESWREWEPGRPLDLELVATVSNAVRRGAIERPGRVTLRPEDFAVVERTSTTSVSTVLAIDRSRSMGQSGGWVAARKVALAMHELIRQSYPRDSLGVLAFSSTAEPVDIDDVPEMPWDRYEHGTHLQAALELGRSMLRHARGGTKQIVVITDGEPTLATIGGMDVFASPPTPEVLNATMTEVIRCTREAITINLVMVGSGAGGGFADQVARVNRGRVYRSPSDRLGAFVVRDYVSR